MENRLQSDMKISPRNLDRQFVYNCMQRSKTIQEYKVSKKERSYRSLFLITWIYD